MTGGKVDGSRYTVLVVDDEALIRKVVQVGLKGKGFEVVEAANGREALERLETVRPDLIVSDVNMPGLDGIALLNAVRERPELRNTPTILLTARGAGEKLIDGYQQGADDYMSKPFSVDELLARVYSKLERPPVMADQIVHDLGTGLLTNPAFVGEAEREHTRVEHSGRPAVLVRMSIHEAEILRERLGRAAENQVLRAFAENAAELARPLDLVGLAPDGGVLLLMPDTTPEQARTALRTLGKQLTVRNMPAGTEMVRITPNFAFTTFDGAPLDKLWTRVDRALEVAAGHLDMEPVQWVPGLDPKDHEKPKLLQENALAARLLDLPGQLLTIVVVGIVLPFCAYLGLFELGIDVSPYVYAIVVLSLLGTASLIWVEAFLAIRPKDPPPFEGEYGPAAALIAAYLPNEAATIMETIDAFLAMQYPGPYEVLLAYNTPQDMPIEDSLRERAAQDPRLRLVRVPHSTSKAQNVNYALDRTSAEMIGIFDADHQPEPYAFSRAWHWLASGADVVQGHCMVRNGGENWLTRTVAVEFEQIYAVAHPGRARMHAFGIFGGSNGYWSRDLLRGIRMQGSMLTEDIDSSLRLLRDGGRIISDPYIISRELAPATPRAWWNQRTRWSQGWFEVSLRHAGAIMFSRSKELSLKNRLGIFHLTVWREMYPWLSFQMYPLMAFFLYRAAHGGDQISWFVPLFVLTSIFTIGTGPGVACVAYFLSHPEIKGNRNWFFFYCFISGVFYAQAKNILGMVAQLRHFRGQNAWKITPRTKEAHDSLTAVDEDAVVVAASAMSDVAWPDGGVPDDAPPLTPAPVVVPPPPAPRLVPDTVVVPAPAPAFAVPVPTASLPPVHAAPAHSVRAHPEPFPAAPVPAPEPDYAGAPAAVPVPAPVPAAPVASVPAPVPAPVPVPVPVPVPAQRAEPPVAPTRPPTTPRPSAQRPPRAPGAFRVPRVVRDAAPTGPERSGE